MGGRDTGRDGTPLSVRVSSVRGRMNYPPVERDVWSFYTIDKESGSITVYFESPYFRVVVTHQITQSYSVCGNSARGSGPILDRSIGFSGGTRGGSCRGPRTDRTVTDRGEGV